MYDIVSRWHFLVGILVISVGLHSVLFVSNIILFYIFYIFIFIILESTTKYFTIDSTNGTSRLWCFTLFFHRTTGYSNRKKARIISKLIADSLKIFSTKICTTRYVCLIGTL